MSPPTESTPEANPAASAATASTSDGSRESPPKRHRELFRMLLSILDDPERAYTVTEEIMSAAGENVVAQLGARIDVLDARMEALGARIDAFVESTNARLEALDARMHAFVESTNARLEALDARMEALGARIDALATIVARMDARIERLENQQSRLMWGVLGLQATLVVAIIAFLLSA